MQQVPQGVDRVHEQVGLGHDYQRLFCCLPSTSVGGRTGRTSAALRHGINPGAGRFHPRAGIRRGVGAGVHPGREEAELAGQVQLGPPQLGQGTGRRAGSKGRRHALHRRPQLSGQGRQFGSLRSGGRQAGLQGDNTAHIRRHGGEQTQDGVLGQSTVLYRFGHPSSSPRLSIRSGQTGGEPFLLQSVPVGAGGVDPGIEHRLAIGRRRLHEGGQPSRQDRPFPGGPGRVCQ